MVQTRLVISLRYTKVDPEYLMYQGLTIGFKDCIIPKSLTKKLFDIARNKLLESKVTSPVWKMMLMIYLWMS